MTHRLLTAAFTTFAMFTTLVSAGCDEHDPVVDRAGHAQIDELDVEEFAAEDEPAGAVGEALDFTEDLSLGATHPSAGECSSEFIIAVCIQACLNKGGGWGCGGIRANCSYYCHDYEHGGDTPIMPVKPPKKN